jgi:hypothetical protein
MGYSDKLRDPRWQKKRLKILERDEFTCQKCLDSSSMLAVHHMIYEKGKEPWDIEDKYLLTLCEECHTEEYDCKEIFWKFPDEIKQKFLSGAAADILIGLHYMEMPSVPDITASMLSWVLQNKELMDELNKRYFEHLKAKRIGGSDN